TWWSGTGTGRPGQARAPRPRPSASASTTRSPSLATRCSSSRPAAGRASAPPKRATRPAGPRGARAPRGVTPQAAWEGGGEGGGAVLEGLDGGPPDTSLPGQLDIAGGEEFYDFEAKYLDPRGSMAIPAPVPPAVIEEVRRMVAVAFEAVSCQGFARVDFFYTRDGTILANEINTIPGMTATSYFPKM